MTLARTASLVVSVVFFAGFVLSLLGGGQAATPSASGVLGDCSKAQVLDAQYLFFVSSPDRQPLSNITITTYGISRETNSSGIAEFPQIGALTEVSVEGAITIVSSEGSASPAFCVGSSYYHVLWLTVGLPDANESMATAQPSPILTTPSGS